MKLASLLLLFAVAFTFSGCNTLVTRRDLYSPSKGNGYWTKKYRTVRKGEGIFGVSNSVYRGAGPGPETGLFGISHPTNPRPE